MSDDWVGGRRMQAGDGSGRAWQVLLGLGWLRQIGTEEEEVTSGRGWLKIGVQIPEKMPFLRRK